MVRYAPMAMGRWFALLIFGAFAVAAVVLMTSTLAGGANAPPPAFTLFWFAGLGWNAYWWLFRFAAELQIDGEDLVWAAPLRTGRVPLAQLSEVRPMRFASNVAVFGVRDGRTILVMATKGLSAFTTEITRRRPGLPVRLGWQARLAERFPGRSRFKRL